MIDRRTVLKLSTAPTAVALSGCMSGFESSATVESVDSQWDSTVFELQVLVLVSNDANSDYSGTLFVQAEPGGVTYTKEREITVLAGETNTYRVLISVDSDDYGNQGRVTAQLMDA